MTTPTDNSAVHFNRDPAPVHEVSDPNVPPRSPPVMMNLPSQDRIDLLFDSEDDDELPAHDETRDYLHSEFVSLFDAHGSDRPETLSAWLPNLPALANELYQLTSADSPAASKLASAVGAIERGRDVTAIDPVYGRSVLHWACMLAHSDLVVLLLSRGADIHVNLSDQQGHSVLGCVHAFRSIPGASRVIDVLLSAGASLDMLPNKGAELLYRKDLSVALVGRLLGSGADPNGGAVRDTTPLLAGCGSIDWGAASLLLDFHADIRRSGTFGMSVLHNPRIPIWLAERFYRLGADVNAKDMQAETPLMLACAQGNIPLVRWLIAKGARLDDVSDDGRTVPDYAAGHSRQMTDWLVRNGHVVANPAADC